MTTDQISQSLSEYTETEILYTVDRLIEAGYLNSYSVPVMGKERIPVIKSISFEGHQFLDCIRDKGIWEQTKEAASTQSLLYL